MPRPHLRVVLSTALAVILSGAHASGSWAATAPRPASCVPATVNASAQVPGTPITVSPQPGALDATPASQVSFAGVAASDLGRVQVSGSHTGAHAGRLLAYSQGDGASFLPSAPFSPGEVVTVSAVVHQGATATPFSFSFAVAVPDAIPTTLESTHPRAAPGDVQGFASRSDLRPPAVRITAAASRPAGGEDFVAPYGGPGQSGPMILDAQGGLVWFKPLATSTDATNLQVQQYRGRPVLTWWQGRINQHGFGWGEGLIDDTSYRQVAVVRAGNGVQADLHEFQITPQGTALVTAYNPIRCNLSTLGGPAQGAVTDSMLQEIDIRTGLVRYQWTSLDHVGLDESYTPVATTTLRWPFDFFHLNSINLDEDGGLLISARDTWAAYEIDRSSGQIRWRLGGKRSSFTLAPGAASAWQHDARELPDGDISLFDNGASPAVHQQSRGEVIHVDPQQGIASLVSQFSRPAPLLLSPSQGNLQHLLNGDWFMGWGQVADFAEFSPAGALLFDAHFPAAEQSYRALRFDWTATPTHPPSLATRSSGRGLAVYASWNGATTVARWRVLLGSRPNALRAVAETGRTGFETAISVPLRRAYAAVQALSATGGVLGISGVSHT